ncbi:hypothetical protein PRIPAC_96139 [Pristionchus pacificus]|uniref:Uncharacterized protein n=1 Tax=Pristionchus pacificus TaxID=54126 RepID=A0A2A6BCB5_PRIPA|nr:hypothetical protein PRIPAC_96139 [Pristionchus pacificus]|eukprot:PDM63529.1 hypothetical protein PRIPAC_53886 [Pristionchus pacificus]
MSTACKKMKLSVTALERDHLSSLADDCLYDIFSRLGQNDLDEISELSTRMHGATIRGRKYACKEDAMTVVITQDNRRQFSFTFTIGKLGERRLERTVKASMKQISERLTDLKGAVNFGGVEPSSELDKLNILMNRFNYDSQFKFEKAFITPIYLEFFERIISNQYVENVTFQEDCVISLDNASRKRQVTAISK